MLQKLILVITTYLIVVGVQYLSCQFIVHTMTFPVTGGMDEPLDSKELLPLHR